MRVISKVTRTIQEEALASEMGATRKLEGWYNAVLKIIAAVFSIFFLYTTFFGLISQETHVGFYFLGHFLPQFHALQSQKKIPG